MGGLVACGQATKLDGTAASDTPEPAAPKVRLTAPPDVPDTPAPASSLEIKPAHVQISLAAQLRLKAFVNLEDGTQVEVTEQADWQVDTPILQIDDAGSVLPLSGGTTRVTARYDGIEGVATVGIVAPEAPPPPAAELTAIQVNAIAPLEAGHTGALHAIGHYADATRRDITEVATWRSNAPGVATVESGVVSGIAAGSAQISAEHQGVTANVQVTVSAPASPPPTPCAYPSAGNRIRLGSTMPNLAWSGVYKADGTTMNFSMEDFHCNPAFDDYSVAIFFVGAEWCGACPSYIQSLAEDADAIRAAGGLLIYTEYEDSSYQPSTHNKTHRYIDRMVGPVPSLRIGDGQSQPPQALGQSSLVRSFPSAFVVRRSDMQIIEDQGRSFRMLDYVQIARDAANGAGGSSGGGSSGGGSSGGGSSGGGSSGGGGTPPPAFTNHCGPGDEEPSEPNDFSSAGPEIGPGTYSGGICAPGPDFYRVDIRGRFRVDLSFSHATGDLDVYAWNRITGSILTLAGRQIGSDSQTDNESFTTLGPATIVVMGYQNASAPYTLTITEQ